MTNRIGINDYAKLIKLKEQLQKKMSKLGRERDLKVNMIDDAYQNKINSIVRDLDFIEGEIANAKKFVSKNG